MMIVDPSIGSTAAMAKTAVGAAEAEQARKQEEESRTSLADVLDGVGSTVDAADLAVAACKAAAEAMKPNFKTGGLETPAAFRTGGGDGVANAFETAADCAPAADMAGATEAAASVLDIAAGAGEAVVDGIGTVLGGLFEGLGSL